MSNEPKTPARDDPPSIDYFNPYARPAPAHAPEPAPARPAAVVPVEFDALLTRSDDHAAVAAVEVALRAAKIATFRTDDGDIAGRQVSIFVRAADHARAGPIAARIFARRARVKSLLPSRRPTEPDIDGPFARTYGIDPLP